MVRNPSDRQSRDRAKASSKENRTIPYHKCNAEKNQPVLTQRVKSYWNTCIALLTFCAVFYKYIRYFNDKTTLEKSKKIQAVHRLFNLITDYRTVRNGKNYSQAIHPKLSVNAKGTADAPVALASEKADSSVAGVSPDLIEEKIKVNLEPLNTQISKLLQLMNQLIRKNSAHISTTADPCTHRTQQGPSPGGGLATSRTSTGTGIGSTGFPLDNR